MIEAIRSFSDFTWTRVFIDPIIFIKSCVIQVTTGYSSLLTNACIKKKQTKNKLLWAYFWSGWPADVLVPSTSKQRFSLQVSRMQHLERVSDARALKSLSLRGEKNGVSVSDSLTHLYSNQPTFHAYIYEWFTMFKFIFFYCFY